MMIRDLGFRCNNCKLTADATPEIKAIAITAARTLNGLYCFIFGRRKNELWVVVVGCGRLVGIMRGEIERFV